MSQEEPRRAEEPGGARRSRGELLLAPHGSSRLLLAPPGSSWLLLAPPGLFWPFLGLPAPFLASWLLLALPGSSRLEKPGRARRSQEEPRGGTHRP